MGNLDLISDRELYNFCDFFQDHYQRKQCLEGGVQIALAGRFHVHPRIASKLLERCLQLGYMERRNRLITFTTKE